MSKLIVTIIDLLRIWLNKSSILSNIRNLALFTQSYNIFRLNETNNKKLLKYWRCTNIDEMLFEADVLYKNGKYLEVYEILNKLKFCNNVEVQWRIARALFKLCNNYYNDDEIDGDIKRRMIFEAYDIITATLPAADNSSKVHKWAAIISDRKSGFEGIEERIKNFKVVKRHLVKCCDINPEDVTSQYLLGKWCYEMCNLNWFQRLVAKFLFAQCPDASYGEAHDYFSKVEDLHPRIHLLNTYFLGKTCMKMGQYYSAKYYLSVTVNLRPMNEYEKQCVNDAKKWIKRLNKYGLEKDVLFYENPFGSNE